VEVDPDRLAQEVAFLADKADVSEEVTRLESHVEQFKECLKTGGGRKMEFLIQEMGREINTIGSKNQQAEVSAMIVQCKSVLERLREQAANVE
jgi:uncharacterized protein (TIGR00255 family)